MQMNIHEEGKEKINASALLKKRKRVWVSGCALLIFIITVVCFFNRDNPMPVLARTIDKGDIEKTVLASGVLKPSVQVSVGAQVSGQLKKLHVKTGDRVVKGQLLAEIDPTLQQNELQKSEAELQSARAQMQSAQALLKQKRQALTRQLALDSDGSGIKSNLEDAQAQFDIQVAQLKVNEALIVQAQTALDTAKANVGYTQITAPISGEVLGIVTKEGQTIVSSQIAPTILVLADVDTMTVHASVSETDILKVHAGQPLWFYVAANPSQRFDSVMGEIQEAPLAALIENDQPGSQNPSSSAVYYTAEFNVANQARLLRSSMTAQVFIITAQAKDVVRISADALGEPKSPDHYVVNVRVDEKIEPREIVTGINNGEYAEVKQGLSEGDEIVMPVPDTESEQHEYP